MTDRAVTRRAFVASSALFALAGTRLAGAQGATPSPSNERVIDHPGGTTTLTGDPRRVVALEWSLVEHALALGFGHAGPVVLDFQESAAPQPPFWYGMWRAGGSTGEDAMSGSGWSRERRAERPAI